MKHKLLLLLALGLFLFQGWATPIDESTARVVVQEFIASKNGQSLRSAPSPRGSDLQLVHGELSSANMSQCAYYIYNTVDGFVIVSGDDRAEQILGYGDGNFDLNDIPCGLQAMLDSYKEQIDYLLDHPELEVETPSLDAPKLSATSVSPLLQAEWDQSKPFNDKCPMDNDGRSLTGCSCTALCQVMYYWKYPKAPMPSLPAYTVSSISVPAWPSTTFDWDNMIDKYYENYSTPIYTVPQGKAVAALMRYVGQAERTYYTYYASGAGDRDILRAAKMLGYNYDAHWVDRRDYTDSQWASLIQSELRAGRPLVYRASDTNSGVGHVFNLVGYDSSSNKYYINWGWRGGGNGYFALNAFDLPNSHYNNGHAFIIGLKPIVGAPSPEIEIDHTSLSFRSNNGEKDYEVFEILGYALTGDLRVTLDDEAGIFSIDRTSISKSDATYGKYVTVSYEPTEAGTSTATVTISGGGAGSKTVVLTGNSTQPTVTVNPTCLQFKSVIGESTSQTFNIKGYKLTENLMLELDNSAGIYTIERTSLTPSEANNGIDVSVTCTPNMGGMSYGSVTVSSSGATPKTITLKGRGLKPSVAVDPYYLNFNSIVGDTVTQVFTVMVRDLTSDLSLTLNDSSGCYTINREYISQYDEGNYINVAVTYCPKESGTHNGTVVISGGGATTKTIELNGTALKPQIALNPESLLFYSGLNHTAIQSFKVKGDYLLGDLSLTLNDSLGIYSISTTNITQTGSHTYADVEVTYNPLFAGPSSAFVTISGGGAETMALSLIGMAKELPVINVDTDSVYLKSTYTGCQSSKSLTITCSDLQKDLQLSLMYDDSNSFELSKQIVTPEEAAAGAEVIVYFNPTSGGKKNARLNICYDGYEAVSIPVSGIAKTSGNIIVSPTDLSFDTQVGTPVTQTFKVTSVNTIYDLTVTLNDTSGIYSIDKTTIARSGEDNISQSIVTVTYHPMKTGTDNATVTISGTGVEPKTVRLSGVTEGPPSVNVDASSIAFESTYTGYQSSRTITITCYDLQNNLQLNLSNDNTNSFGLSKSTISPEDAVNGVPVTVYFNPSTCGFKYAKLNICYDGCKVFTIPLSGTAIKSDGYITAGSTFLSFETQVGTPITQTFLVAYSNSDGGAIMISRSEGEDETGSDSEGVDEGTTLNLNAISNLSNLPKSFIKLDSIKWHRKDLIGPIEPILLKSLVLELTGDDCFNITPSRIRLSSVPCSAYVTVTYNPETVGEHDASIKTMLTMGSARPFILPLHGTATAQLFAPNCDNEGNDLMITQNELSINTLINEMMMDYEVYAEGQNIIIDCPKEEHAIISDIVGHAWCVNLKTGRNEISVNAGGIYIVRIREKSTKLMLK